MIPAVEEIARDIVAAFASHESLFGIALCGSYSDGTYDRVSDVDIWVYHAPDVGAQEIGQIAQRTPGNYVLKDAHSSAYTLVEYIARDVLVSVKFISSFAIEEFIERQRLVVFDEMLYEDMETFMKWRVLWERAGYLTAKSHIVREQFQHDVERLRKIAERRYGDMIWRSVFQGVYRNDSVQWIMLIMAAINALTVGRALLERWPPPPMKWRFSPRNLGRLGLEDTVGSLIPQIRCASNVDSMLDVYVAAREAEESLFDHLPYDRRWWWKAFNIDDQHVHVPADVEARIRRQFGPGAWPPQRSGVGSTSERG